MSLELRVRPELAQDATNVAKGAWLSLPSLQSDAGLRPRRREWRISPNSQTFSAIRQRARVARALTRLTAARCRWNAGSLNENRASLVVVSHPENLLAAHLADEFRVAL